MILLGIITVLVMVCVYVLWYQGAKIDVLEQEARDEMEEYLGHFRRVPLEAYEAIMQQVLDSYVPWTLWAKIDAQTLEQMYPKLFDRVDLVVMSEHYDNA